MNSLIFLFAFFFWGLLWISDPLIRLFCAVVILIFLVLRFRHERLVIIAVVVWTILSLFSIITLEINRSLEMNEPEPGEYLVTSIHSNYAIARSMNPSGELKHEVVVYESSDLVFQDVIELNQFDRIESLNNPGGFSFEKRMKQKGIAYSSSMKNQKRFADSGSLRARIYRALTNRFDPESKQGKLIRLFFYGISFKEVSEWISRMGLPLLGLFDLIRKGFKRFLDISFVCMDWIVLVLIVIYGECFFWNTVLLRLFIFTLFRVLLNKHKDWRVPCSLIVFLLLSPNDYSEFSLCLPLILWLNRKFQNNSICAKIQERISLLMMQAIYFSNLNLWMIVGYRKLRSLFGFFFLLTICLLFVESECLTNLLFEVLSGEWNFLNSMTFHGMVNPLIMAIFILTWIYGVFKPDKKTPVMFASAFLLYLFSFRLDPFFHVYQLDIGQGDCAVIIEPFQKSVVMIDAAGNRFRNNSEKIIVPFLKSHHIDTIDALVISHDDFDHSGSVEDLLNHQDIEIKEVITSSDQKIPVDYPFHSLRTTSQSGVHSNAMQSSFSETEIDEGNDKVNGQITELDIDINDLSLISYFAYDNFRFLWTGDASSAIERELIHEYTVDADVLKAGHHGSNTSSDPEFLSEVKPELALISAGKNNRYGHPHIQTLENLKESGCDVLSTANDGAIHLKTFRNLMIIETDSGLIGYIWK